MNLSLQQVQHISDLAKLDLSEAEIAKFRRQLSSILEYVELLNEVNTESTEVTAQTTGLKNVSREDKPSREQVLTQEEVLENAPKKQGGYIETEAVL